MFSLFAIQENPTTVDLEEGPCWIGAKARTKDGRETFPIGTGLVRLSEGEHHVRFELVPVAVLEGRVKGAAPGRELLVGLASGDGRLVPLDGGRDEMRPFTELGIDGWFRWPQVPSGTFELRVGTREELLNGCWTKREEIVLRPGEAHTIAIQL